MNIFGLLIAPTGGGVIINPHTGAFAGYAWAENVGWIGLRAAADPRPTGWSPNFAISKSICPWS